MSSPSSSGSYPQYTTSKGKSKSKGKGSSSKPRSSSGKSKATAAYDPFADTLSGRVGLDRFIHELDHESAWNAVGK
ncbi:hypothetical protein VTJ04DRAFT_3413 [Mycothermus thermophilus]|uniref:uncharacterized protein n=1 Tax=Humicola insolens TaxID=85995 RepID=UPI003743DDFE